MNELIGQNVNNSNERIKKYYTLGGVCKYSFNNKIIILEKKVMKNYSEERMVLEMDKYVTNLII